MLLLALKWGQLCSQLTVVALLYSYKNVSEFKVGEEYAAVSGSTEFKSARQFPKFGATALRRGE